MSKEKITPASKSVPSSGGVKDGANSTLTTPKQSTGGEAPWGKESKESVMK